MTWRKLGTILGCSVSNPIQGLSFQISQIPLDYRCREKHSGEEPLYIAVCVSPAGQLLLLDYFLSHQKGKKNK